MARKFRVKRGLKANIPVLDQGEFGFCTDSGAEQLFIGNGGTNIEIARKDALNSHASRHASGGADPITPSMIGALPVSVVKNTGTSLDDYTTPGVYYFNSSYTPTDIPIGSNGWLQVMTSENSAAVKQLWWRQGTADSNDHYMAIRTLTSGVWSSWHQLATTDYAVNKAGDTMTGTLVIKKASPIVDLMNTTDNSEGLLVQAENASILMNRNVTGVSGTRRQLSLFNSTGQGSVANALKLVDLVDGTVTSNNTVLHTGNKPSGSYTGNGDATSRAIDTGGIGHVLYISGNGYSSIVFINGGISNRWNATLSGLSTADAIFTNGVLTLTTANDALNANNVTYYYQVL